MTSKAHELRLLAALLVPAGLALAFLTLANEVMRGETLGIDQAILLALRAPGDSADPIGPAWLEHAIKDITSLGSLTVLALITLAAVNYLMIAGKRRSGFLLLAAVGGGTLLGSLLKGVFERPRPDLVAHIVDVSTSSFPSSHAMLSAVTFLTIGALLARTEGDSRRKIYVMGLAVVLTLLVGLSRLYLGVHYPSDVLAGWIVGSAWAALCWQVEGWLQRRGEVEPASS